MSIDSLSYPNYCILNSIAVTKALSLLYFVLFIYF